MESIVKFFKRLFARVFGVPVYCETNKATVYVWRSWMEPSTGLAKASYLPCKCAKFPLGCADCDLG